VQASIDFASRTLKSGLAAKFAKKVGKFERTNNLLPAIRRVQDYSCVYVCA
jgi:hypothetical protein